MNNDNATPNRKELLNQEFKLLINGELTSGESKEFMETVDPSNGEIIAKIPNASIIDVNNTIVAAKKAQKKWALTSLEERQNSVLEIAKILKKYSFGTAHQRTIHIIERNAGITVTGLLKKLKVTKQSLNRVLKDLIKLETLSFKKDKKDTRIKHVFLSDKGEKIFSEIFLIQKKRIYNALLNSTSEEVLNFDNVLNKIINE
jgi:DNA-binding MarR family transcriptional regulator